MTPAGIQKQIILLMKVNNILQSLPSNYLKDLIYKAMKCNNLQLELNKTNNSWYELPLLQGDTMACVSESSQEALKKGFNKTNVSWHT